MERKDERRKLPVKLTEDELLQRGKSLAEKGLEVDALEAQKAAEAKRIGDEIADAKKDRSKLQVIVESGEELNLVRCVWHLDLSAKQWSLVRQDTGEVIQQQTVTPEELQMSLHAVS